MNTVNQLKTVKGNTSSKVANELSRTGGRLRLAPAWEPRSFLHAYSASRGGIDERWFASTT